MPSKLRFQIPLDSQKVSSSRPTKKPKMSLSQTYYIASTARVKLGKEAVKPDHNLRRLVGHANLLDALMIELRDAERQQEAWFNKSVAKAQDDEDRHFSYQDTIVEEDSDSDIDEEEYQMVTSGLRSIKQSPVILSSEDDEIFEDEEDLPELALTRTSSHPPELVHDSDSDDESPPASPPQSIIDFSSSKALPVINLHTGQKPQQSVVIQTTPMIEAY